LKILLDSLRVGDVLIVRRIDRLVRSVGDLRDIVRTLRAKNAAPAATEHHNSTATAKCFLDRLSVLVEFKSVSRASA